MPSEGQQEARGAEPALAVEPSDPAVVHRLGTTARTWRVVVTLAALTVLIIAQLMPVSRVDTNDWFPLGSLSQYAFAGDPDGTVKSASVVGVTASGDEVRVWLDQMGIGVGHAEIEAQLGRIVADPSLLQGVARAYTWRYPDRPPLVELRLEQTTTQLHDGKPTGTPTTVVLATWAVPGAADGGSL
jgi:hypothetical protein